MYIDKNDFSGYTEIHKSKTCHPGRRQDLYGHLKVRKDMAETYQDQEFLDYVVKGIVNHPEDVSSTRTVDERGVLLTLDVNSSDIGYVIGRRGQTVRALRTLLRVVGAKNNASVNLKINEPEGSRGPRRSEESREESSAPADVDTSVIDNIQI